ncbi:MAG: hypothetical protein ABSD58_05645 [Verrucomicrobiia bacterium]|jgi:hypothetical protein
MAGNVKSLVYECLNADFRKFSILDTTCFPDHEFDTEEADRLCRFCLDIQESGYDAIEPRLVDKPGRDLLDLAAEYGVFVDARIGEAYLGVFILGQMLMQPYAREGFCSAMMRSEVYQSAKEETKQYARFLMLLATFVPGKYFNNQPRQTMSEEQMVEATELNIAGLDMRSVQPKLAAIFGREKAKVSSP